MVVQSQNTRSAEVTMGMKICTTLTENTVANTEKFWIRNAVSHCFALPPLSRGQVAKNGGAIR